MKKYKAIQDTFSPAENVINVSIDLELYRKVLNSKQWFLHMTFCHCASVL